MERVKSIVRTVLHPSIMWTILLTLLSIAMLIFIFSTNREQTIFAYISYVLSAYSLTVLIIVIPKITARIELFVRESEIVDRIKSFIYSNEHSNQFITDIPFRTKIFLYASLSINLLYAVLKLIAGIHYASFWYGADAVYYIVLSAVQFILLRHIPKEGFNLENEYRQYRFCGYLLFVLNAALIGVVYQIVNQERGYQYPGLLIYVVAAYAFFCLTLSIVNVVRYRKLKSPVLSAVKAIRLAKALVAIFALQTAMLSSFGSNESESFKVLMKSLTGGGVCFIIFVMAVFMVVRANKNLKKTSINNSETIL